MIPAALTLLAAYGLGTLPFAYLVTRGWAGIDLRHAGSGNMGAANVTRTAGPVLGAIVLALDVAKGVLAMWLAQRVGVSLEVAALAGIGAVVGHVFPVWFGFRGGKGVATACGVFSLLAPRALMLAAIAFVVIVSATRYVSLASVGAAVVLPLAMVAAGEPRVTLLASCATAVIILLRHRENISRLQAGTEPMLGHKGDRE
jgi:glycerol-3-phosphate acyltransferase PlsY